MTKSFLGCVPTTWQDSQANRAAAYYRSGGIRMELIRGNLLFLIALIEVIFFLGGFVKWNDGAFEGMFLFYRRERMRKEIWLAGKLIVGSGVTGTLLYYLLCTLLNGNYVPVWYLLFLFLLPAGYYFIASAVVVIRSATGFVCMLTMTYLLVGIGIFICMIWRHMRLDSYCGIFTIFLLVADCILGKKMIKTWEKGDL